MNNKIILTFIISYLFVSQIPVLAVDVTQWDGAGQLQISIQAGSDVTLLNDITASGGSTVISPILSPTATLATHFISGNNTTSIFNNAVTLTILNGTLQNGSGTNGGAISNISTLKLTDVNFTNNTASGLGGAIYNQSGDLTITAKNNNVTFSGNNAASGGNDIYIGGGNLTLDAQGNNTIIFNDGISGALSSGNIYKTGTGILDLNGDNSGFSGNFYQTNGTTNISHNFFSALNAIQGGTLNCESGSALTGGYNIQLTQINSLIPTIMNIEEGATISPGVNTRIGVGTNTTLNIKNTSSIDFNAALSGGGTINKTTAGTINFTKDNHLFTGSFNQTAGISNFSSNFFGNGSTSTIDAGTLDFKSGSDITVGSSIILNNSANAIMETGSTINDGSGLYANITVNNNAIFDIQKTDFGLLYVKFDGNGFVKQTGSGDIFYQGDDHNFTGTFTQTAGTSEFASGVFGGTSTITNSIINFNGGAHLYNGSRIYLTKTGGLTTTMNISPSKAFQVTMDSGSSIDVGSGTTLNINNGSFVHSLDIYTTLTGASTGTINNTSSNDVNFYADNSGFVGTYDQTTACTSNVYNKFFAGTSKIEAGTLNLQSGANLPATSIVQLTDTGFSTEMNVNDGSTMATGSSISVGTNTTLNFNNTSTYDLNASVSGAGTINKNNAGTLNVNNSITGGPSINLNAGTLALANDSYINGSNLVSLVGH